MAIFHHPNGHLPHLFLILFIIPAVSAIRADVATEKTSYNNPSDALLFHEAPAFRNADYCNVSFSGIDGAMDDYGRRVHIAMTLDANYLRGTMAAVHSILQHTACPDNLTFHFLAARYETAILATITYSFPYLDFVVHRFDQDRVRGRISRSIRKALDQPLNYARIYLAHILPPEVDRVIYLDSDVIVVDDITSLWKVDLEGNIVAAPEYCHANFTKYFTDAFWKKPKLSRTFQNRRACYFNTGVMVMDVNRWRVDGYTRKMEEWMGVQKKERIYILGSLPPFLLVAAGNIKAVDHKWNQHGLGGDNIEGKCRKLHPGPISLLHWSGKGKPWLRLDSRKPCSVDRLWAPYDPFPIQSSIIPWVL